MNRLAARRGRRRRPGRRRFEGSSRRPPEARCGEARSMLPVRRAVLLLVAVALVAAGCGSSDSATTPTACLAPPPAYLKALEGAPGAVRLGGETPISDCLVDNQSAGDLADVGASMVRAANRCCPPPPARTREASRRCDWGIWSARFRRGRRRRAGSTRTWSRRIQAAARYAQARRRRARARSALPTPADTRRVAAEADTAAIASGVRETANGGIMATDTSTELWGEETRKAVANFPVSGAADPGPRRALAGADQGRRGAGQRGARPARRFDRRADRGRRRRGGGGRARRPVPDRRLPDRLRHLVEHERQRGDREPRGRRRPSERPREHGTVVERRLSLRRPPGGPRRGDPRPAAGDGRARLGAGAQGRGVRRRGQGRPHAPDGRRSGHPRPGVRRLRRSDQAGHGQGARHAGPRRSDPARRHRHRHRASTRTPSSPSGCAPSSPRKPGWRSPSRSTASRRRATATRWSSSPGR